MLIQKTDRQKLFLVHYRIILKRFYTSTYSLLLIELNSPSIVAILINIWCHCSGIRLKFMDETSWFSYSFFSKLSEFHRILRSEMTKYYQFITFLLQQLVTLCYLKLILNDKERPRKCFSSDIYQKYSQAIQKGQTCHCCLPLSNFIRP